MRVTIQNVLDRLERPRRSGKGWTARCPAHNDKDPSLSVTEGRDGRILLHCHAGCQYPDITQALGFRTGDLTNKPTRFGVTGPRRRRRRLDPPPPPPSPKPGWHQQDPPRIYMPDPDWPNAFQLALDYAYHRRRTPGNIWIRNGEDVT